jgi:hypothetical protein
VVVARPHTTTLDSTRRTTPPRLASGVAIIPASVSPAAAVAAVAERLAAAGLIARTAR